MQRSQIPIFFLGLSAVIAISALTTLILKTGQGEFTPQVENAPTKEKEIAWQPSTHIEPDKQKSQRSDAPAETPSANTPEALASLFQQALEAGNFSKISTLLGASCLSPEDATKLQALLTSPLRAPMQGALREVGELELNKKSRWILTLQDQAGATHSFTLDIQKIDEKWQISRFSLASASEKTDSQASALDSLHVADAFLQDLLSQRFEQARARVDLKAISDAKIAALCILFEEGGYIMRSTKPLRAMFHRDNTSGYLAHVVTKDGKTQGQFSMTLQQIPPSSPWLISEINLDQLLADYAGRIAEGDAYYTPLVKNPAGGDTLALYFDFDQDSMNSRTRRQLEIVTLILKSDSTKKITLSGHADARGTKDYNNQLSSRRATVVRDFLVAAQVTPEQIITVAKGDSQPRRPNVTESGTDNPDGRRANRRTEIYLDF